MHESQALCVAIVTVVACATTAPTGSHGSTAPPASVSAQHAQSAEAAEAATAAHASDDDGRDDGSRHTACPLASLRRIVERCRAEHPDARGPVLVECVREAEDGAASNLVDGCDLAIPVVPSHCGPGENCL